MNQAALSLASSNYERLQATFPKNADSEKADSAQCSYKGSLLYTTVAIKQLRKASDLFILILALVYNINYSTTSERRKMYRQITKQKKNNSIQ